MIGSAPRSRAKGLQASQVTGHAYQTLYAEDTGMSHEETDNRVTELEIKLAHMETVVSDLSDMIKSQWDRIDLLERQNKLMSSDVKRMIDFLRTSPEDDAPPPHY